MGNIDKLIRLVIALTFVLLNYFGVVSGALGIVLLVLAFVFLATSFLSFCPLYTIFGISTCKTKE